MPFIPMETLIAACTLLLTALVGTFSSATIKAIWMAFMAEQQRDAATGVAMAIGEIREVFRDPPHPPCPTMKIDPPEMYEGKPEKIMHWLRSMRAYFQMVGLTGIVNNITISLQQMKGGMANRAENWAGVKMQEFLDFQTEWIERDVALEGMTWALCRMGREVAPARLGPDGTVMALAVTEVPAFANPPPFDGWGDFQDKALAFFMTTETRDEAIRHLQELRQGKR